MNLRAVCTDIDGTLLDRDRQLSSRTIAVIRRIKDRVPIILASSRMPEAMYHLQKELDITSHPMICFNGGYVLYFDHGSGAPVVFDSVQMPLTVVEQVLQLARNTNLHVSLFVENEWYAAVVDQWTERETMITKVSPAIVSFDDIIMKWQDANSGLHKIMCMGTVAEVDKIQQALEFSNGHEIHLYRSKSTYLEIAPKIISKATALEMVMREKFNSTLSEVIAFGDNYNDIEMIRDAGVGVAVGNAIPEVKAVAKEVTLPAKEDGVAITLEKYFLTAT